jgi:hypothetical protein
MSQRAPWWLNLVFVFVGVIVVYALGALLSFVVGGIDSRIPAAVVGPLLCPANTQAQAPYVRSFGGVSGPILTCTDATGAVVATFRTRFIVLWDALFVVPLLPLAYLIAVGLRRHQLGVTSARARPAPPPVWDSAVGPSARSAAGRLAELAELRAHGLVSEAEYQRKRAEILAEL